MCGLTRYGVARYQSVTPTTRIVSNTFGSRYTVCGCRAGGAAWADILLTVWGCRGGGAAWADMLIAVLLRHWAVSAVTLPQLWWLAFPQYFLLTLVGRDIDCKVLNY